MKGGRFLDLKGFTLVELMLVIVIVGILASIPLPYYMGFVERARITEATGIIGGIITSQRVEKAKTARYYDAGDTTTFKRKGVDIIEANYFTYTTAADVGTGGFTITATSTDAFGQAGGWITYTFNPGATPRKSWTCDGTVILPDMLPTEPSG